MKIAYRNLEYLTPASEPITCPQKLKIEIERALAALESAYCGFDNVTDPDLIDCYIFQVNSALKRYRYLLSQVQKINDSISVSEVQVP